jgi:general secretion pathway protein G
MLVPVRSRIASTLRRADGFTLIELLIVFSLLALLLTIAAPRYLGALENAREKVRMQNMATLRDALDKFRADQGRYPSELPELVNKQYLRGLPIDPVSGTTSWIPLPHPGALEPGVYDISPPEAPAASSGPARVTGTPLDQSTP